MVQYSNSLEGGTNTTVITTGNSGGSSGTAFGNVQGSPIYDNTRAAHGSLSAKLTPTSGNPCTIQLGGTGSGWGSTSFAFRFYIYYTALPSTTYTLFRANDDNASTMAVRYNIDSAGKLILGYNNGGVVTAWTATNAIPLNQWIRVEGRIVRHASAGEVAGAYYAADSGTAIDSFSGSSLNTGTTAITAAVYGKYGNDTSATAFWLDDVKADTATTSFIGAVANVAPTGTVTANQNVAAAAAVTATVSASDSDGSISSYAWTVVSASSTSTPTLSGSSTATVSFTAPAAGNLVTLQCVVTDNGGATLTLTTEVRVPTSGNFTTLGISGTGATWTNTGGAANDGAALADSSDATYSESPDYVLTESERRWRLQPITSRTAMTLTWRSLVTATGGTKKARLYEGSTLRQEWTVTQSLTAADQTLTVTSPGAISDFGNLWVAEAVAS